MLSPSSSSFRCLRLRFSHQVLRPKSIISSCRIPALPATFITTALHLRRRHRSSQFLPEAASSLSGSAADYPEQLVGDAADRRQKKRRSVAGVDQEELLEPNDLADADSFFFEFNGVQIHHKICHHEAGDEEEVKEPSLKSRSGEVVKIGLPMILLHGFGASVFSWDRVMKPLARMIGSKVLAFDRPAFGLTSRVSCFGQAAGNYGVGHARPLNPYSMAFSVLATLSFMDLLGTGKSILMGHSAGCLVAVQTYFEAPERVAALVLVAPAIVAPLALQKAVNANELDKDNQKRVESSNAVAQENPIMKIWKALGKLCIHLVAVAWRMLQGMRNMVGFLYSKALSAILRSTFALMLVRMVIDKLGVLAIRNAWFDASQVTGHILTGYTKPLKAKGWDMALLEYTLALLTDSASKPSLTDRLSQISCPVLIITGDTDRLVPSWNAERLSKAIPGSSFQVIKNCGHLPHEERVEEFLMVIESFLKRIFSVPDGQFIEAAV